MPTGTTWSSRIWWSICMLLVLIEESTRRTQDREQSSQMPCLRTAGSLKSKEIPIIKIPKTAIWNFQARTATWWEHLGLVSTRIDNLFRRFRPQISTKVDCCRSIWIHQVCRRRLIIIRSKWWREQVMDVGHSSTASLMYLQFTAKAAWSAGRISKPSLPKDRCPATCHLEPFPTTLKSRTETKQT